MNARRKVIVMRVLPIVAIVAMLAVVGLHTTNNSRAGNLAAVDSPSPATFDETSRSKCDSRTLARNYQFLPSENRQEIGGVRLFTIHCESEQGSAIFTIEEVQKGSEWRLKQISRLPGGGREIQTGN